MNTFSSILNTIQQGQFSPVYLLMGEEPYFIDQISDRLMARVVEEHARDFDMTVLYGKDTNVDQILEAVKRYPMLGNQQLIIVREAQYLERSIDQLASYCAKPQAQTVLVLCYKYKKVDQRKKVVKNITQNGIVFLSKALYDDKVPSWIAERATHFKLSLAQTSLGMLAAYLGSDLGKIDRELEKLSLALGESTEVTPALIEKHIGFSKAFNVFELQKALGARNLHLAYRIVQYMAQNPNQHPITVTVSTLFSFFQKLFMYHSLPSPSQAAKALGVHPFFVKDYEAASKKFSLRQTAQVFTVLQTIDRKSKGVGAHNYPVSELMKEMVLKIVSV